MRILKGNSRPLIHFARLRLTKHSGRADLNNPARGACPPKRRACLRQGFRRRQRAMARQDDGLREGWECARSARIEPSTFGRRDLVHENKPASALLIVLAGTTGLLALLFTCWQMGSWADDLVGEREQCIKRFYATEMVLSYGLTQVRQKFDVLRTQVEQSTDPVQLFLTRLMIDGRTHEVVVTVDRPVVAGQTLVVRAAIVVEGRTYCCLRCLLERIKPHSKQEDPRFVVHHFGSTVPL